MGYNINENKTNIVPFQSGKGIPTHISPLGSVYIDNTTGVQYINKDGLAGWAFFYDSTIPISGGTGGGGAYVPLSGGTMSGTLYAPTFSGGTFYGDGSHLTGVGGTFNGGTVTGSTIFTSGLTANTISATTYQNLPATPYLPLSGGTVTGNTVFTSGLTATTLNVGQIFSVNSNGNVGFGTNISGGTTNGMWYDATNKALNINNQTPQSTYNLEVNGTIRSNNGIFLGQYSAPSLSATTGTSGTLTAGTYYYIVTTVDNYGNSTNGSNEVSATLPIGTTNGSIYLTWNLISGASSYNLYRSTGGTKNENQYINVSSSIGASSVPTTVSYTDKNYTGYTNGTVPAFNASAQIAIQPSAGRTITSGGALFVGDGNNYLSDVVLTLNPSFSVAGPSSSGSTPSNRLIVKGLSWNSTYGATPSVGFLQMNNVLNNNNPTIDKLSFSVGSATQSNYNGSTLNGVERFNIQTDGSFNHYLSNKFNVSQSLTGNGNINLYSGSTTVYGNVTNFLTQFNIGDTFTAGTNVYTVTAITSDSQLSISPAFSGTLTSNQITILLYSGASSGVTYYGDVSKWAFAPNTQITISGSVYTVISSAAGTFYLGTNFTGTTSAYTYTTYNTYNTPYYLNGGTKFNVNANGQTTINGKLSILSGVTGSSASVGTAKFTSGVVTLTNTCITSNSKVFLTVTAPSGNIGIPTRSGTTTNSMQIVSLSAGTTAVQTGDNSTFDYWIIN